MTTADPLFPAEKTLRSAVKQLLSDQKVTVPADICEAVGWPSGRKGSLSLIADLDEPGHLILLLAEVARPLIRALADQLEADDTAESVDAQQVVSDRYQPLNIDAKGHRVRLTEHVLIHLGVAPGANPWLFITARGDRVEVMTTEYRNKRLAKWRAHTALE